MKKFLNNYFTDEEMELIEKSQKARIDSQYYSDRNVSDELYERMVNHSVLFLARCKEVLHQIDEGSINQLRNGLNSHIEENK